MTVLTNSVHNRNVLLSFDTGESSINQEQKGTLKTRSGDFEVVYKHSEKNYFNFDVDSETFLNHKLSCVIKDPSNSSLIVEVSIRYDDSITNQHLSMFSLANKFLNNLDEEI